MSDDTLLFRQIHPSWVKDNKVSYLAFTPLKDKRKLSIYDGDQITAECSWQHYTNKCGNLSAGVMAVTVGECKEHGRAVKINGVPFKEHGFIDFTGLSNKQVRNMGKVLTSKADDRGWRYRRP